MCLIHALDFSLLSPYLIKRDSVNPRLVALTPRDHPLGLDGVDGNEVILAAARHVLPVGRPTHASQTAEIRPETKGFLRKILSVKSN